MTELPINQFESGAPTFPPEEAVASDRPHGPDATADIPDDLKQRFLAAIEADYRVHVIDLVKLEAALYAPPDVRAESFEDHMAKLDDLIDEQPLPMFMQRTG